jgi:predicted cobalt transporter CbtA
MIAAPLLRRYHLRSPVLVAGACTVVVVAMVGLAHQDPRIGQAAIEANRRQYLYVLACELPVLILALISLRNSKWTFFGWAGRSI